MKALATLIMLFFITYSYSQCTINYSVTTPGAYPSALTNGMVNDPYSQDLTILYPTDTSGVNYTSFQIVSVILPMGLTWECVSSSNCSTNPQQDPYTCIRIYGTPAVKGTFAVDITSKAELADNSTQTHLVSSSITIYPPIKVNGTFTMSPSSGCESATVNFSLNNPSSYTPVPNQTTGISYSWDFGNGQNSTNQAPPAQSYSSPGTYDVSLTQVIDTTGFYLNSISITGVGCTDFTGYGEPDIFIELLDGSNNVVYSTSKNDNNLPQNYTMNVQLNNPPYQIRVLDEDDDNLFGSDDDNCIDGDENLATTPITLPGVNQYGNTTQNGSNGSLTFSYDIKKDTSHVETTDVVEIYPNPAVPVVTGNLTPPVSISTPDLGHIYHWNLDGNRLNWVQSTTIYPYETGDYTVIAVNQYGCYSESNPMPLDFAAINEDNMTSFEMYPNPSNGIVQINFSQNMGEASIVVTDLSGRVIIQKEVISNSETINVASLAQGIYNVAIKNNRQIITKKLVVNN